MDTKNAESSRKTITGPDHSGGSSEVDADRAIYLLKCHDYKKCGPVCLNKLNYRTFNILSKTQKMMVLSLPFQPDPKLLFGPNTTKKNAMKQAYVEFPWLIRCLHKQSFLCKYCLLFSQINVFWKIKSLDWCDEMKNITSLHAGTTMHLQSVLRYLDFMNCCKRESLLGKPFQGSEEINAIHENRTAFNRIIDFVCYHHKHDILGIQKSPDTLELITKYDFKLQAFVKMFFEGNTSRDFPGTFQNIAEIIVILIKDKIKEQLKTAEFVAMLVQQVDFSTGPNIWIIFRYFNQSKLCDRTVALFEISSSWEPSELGGKILGILKEYGCCDKLMSQTYDGLPLPADEIKTLHSLIQNECPLAYPIWFSEMHLNVYLFNKFNRNSPVKRFFSVIKSLVEFFNSFQTLFSTHKQQFDPNSISQLHPGIINNVFMQYDYILLFFKQLIKSIEIWDSAIVSGASNLLPHLKDFQFYFCLETFKAIFTETELLHERYTTKICVIQSTDIVIVKEECRFTEFIEEFKGSFEFVYSIAVQKCGEPFYSTDNPISKEYYHELFLDIIETAKSECLLRYSNQDDLKFLQILKFYNFDNYEDSLKMVTESRVSVFFPSKKFYKELKCLNILKDYKNLCPLSFIEKCIQSKTIFLFRDCVRFSKLMVTLPLICGFNSSYFANYNRIHERMKNLKHLNEFSIIALENELLETLKLSPKFYEKCISLYLNKTPCKELTLLETRPQKDGDDFLEIQKRIESNKKPIRTYKRRKFNEQRKT